MRLHVITDLAKSWRYVYVEGEGEEGEEGGKGQQWGIVSAAL